MNNKKEYTHSPIKNVFDDISKRHKASTDSKAKCRAQAANDAQATRRGTFNANKDASTKHGRPVRSQATNGDASKDGWTGSHVSQMGSPTKPANSKGRKPARVYDPLYGRHQIPVVNVPDLMEQVVDDANIMLALCKTYSKPNKAVGVDHKTVRDVCVPLMTSMEERNKLRNLLLEGEYTPSAVRTRLIPKPGGKKRKLGIATVLDRVVQRMILQVIERNYPTNAWNPVSYAYRPNTSVADAVEEAGKVISEGYKYAISIDLKAFFDNVPHDRLLAKLNVHITDRRVTRLVKRFLTPVVICEGKLIRNRVGTPQGSVISPWLASKLYLDELDQELIARGHRFVRYADDCTVFAKSLKAAKRIKARIVDFIENTMKCPVNKEKTKISPIGSVSLLGVYRKGQQWKIKRDKEQNACGGFLDRLRKYEATTDKWYRGKAQTCFVGFVNHYQHIPDLAAKKVPALRRWSERKLESSDRKVMLKCPPPPIPPFPVNTDSE